MRAKQKFQSEKDLIKSQVPAFEDFHAQVSSLLPIPKINEIVETDGSYKIDSICYISKKHIPRIKDLVGHADIIPIFKSCPWAYFTCKFTGAQIAFARIDEDTYVVFFNTISTFTAISMWVGTMQECMRAYYDYVYSDYYISLQALCSIVRPSVKFDPIGLDLYSMEKYLNSLLELILTSDVPEVYCTDVDGQYRFNTKFLCDEEPIIVQCDLNENKKITSISVSPLLLPPFNNYMPINRNTLSFATIEIDEKTLDHLIRTDKYPQKLPRKKLSSALITVIRESVFGCQYIENMALSHFHNRKPCLSFKFPDSEHYLVCHIKGKEQDLSIHPKTVISTRTAQILACTMQTLY